MDNMLNPGRDSQTYENANTEQHIPAEYQLAIPRITIDDPDQNRTINYESSSSTETEMSSSQRRSSTSTTKGRHASSKKSKKDDWSEITDPEERRRVQNRIAQRKFRDKAKETKERQEREAENRAHAHHSYHTPDPTDMGPDEQLSGLPWGSLSLRHVVSRGHAKESESRRGSRIRGGGGGGSSSDIHSNSQFGARDHEYEGEREQLYDDRDGYYEEASPTYYDDGGDRAYYDYASNSGGSNSGGSGSGHGGTSH